MSFNKFLSIEGEKPLDNIVSDGGYISIFRTIACIGDSLSSGEFESIGPDGNKGYHDMFEYSWGQYIARMAGTKVYNFSRGGMTASEYTNSFAEANGFWDTDKLCQAYIIALGHNDLFGLKQDIGSIADIDKDDYNKNAPTVTGYYAKIIQRIKLMQPEARFFLITMPYTETSVAGGEQDKLAKALYDMADFFSYTYVVDLRKYGPVHDEEFRKAFYLGGHLNPAGYVYCAKQIASYIDYIIRNNMDDFKQVPFIGTGLKYTDVKSE